MSAQNSRTTMTRQAIDAQFAEQTYHQSITNPDLMYNLDSHNSDRSRNYALKKRLITMYMENFKMDARQAGEEVEREMGDKYAPNRWDTPAPKQQQQLPGSAKKLDGNRMESVESGRCTKYSEEQWDLFENLLK